MDGHLKEESKEFDNEVDRMKFEKKTLNLCIFMMLLQVVFIFILFKKLI
jgi:hypothetical protein